MFSDEVIGMNIAHRRQSAHDARYAQNIINGMANTETRLERRVRELEAEAARERGLRLVAETRLEELLDTEV